MKGAVICVFLPSLSERVLKGERVAISKAISAIENQSNEVNELLKQIYPHTGRAFIVGITGPPGTGKSSLVDRLIKTFRAKDHNQRIAVLAVDPSSPLSGGAILGDRVRMLEHSLDPSVYIRSMASRGHEGGLAQATRNAIRVLDAAGNSMIIVETVGIGQAEVEIMRVADLVLVVLMPELGDEIQAVKAGLMEIGDVFAVNKSDLPGADKVVYNLESALGQKGEWKQTVVKVSAKTGEGLGKLAEIIEEYLKTFSSSKAAQGRKLENLKEELIANVSVALAEKAQRQLKGAKKLDVIVEKVARRKLDPYSATELLLKEVSSSRRATKRK
jgi:LAO/AO transport system kinase